MSLRVVCGVAHTIWILNSFWPIWFGWDGYTWRASSLPIAWLVVPLCSWYLGHICVVGVLDIVVWTIHLLILDFLRWLHSVLYWVFTKVVDRFSVLHQDTLRETFRHVHLVNVKQFQSAHSHPTAAGLRSIADLSISNTIVNSGFREFSISPSDADDRNGIAGVRYFYSIKSMCQRARYETLPDRCIVKLVDVDYYLDMPALLAYGRPVLLYTFVPKHSSGPVPDGMYTIDINDTIKFRVAGGGSYEHQVWDYERDVISVSTWWGAIIYSVEQLVLPQDNQRRLVGLFPRRTIYGPLGWVFAGHHLKRRCFNRFGWIMSRFMDVMDGEMTEFTSVSRPESPLCVTVPTSLGHGVAIKIKSSNANGMPFATVQTALNTLKELPKYSKFAEKMVPLEVAPLLTSAASEAPELYGVSDVTVISCPGYHYTCVNKTRIWDEELPSLRSIGNPIMQSAVVPTRCEANDLACIEHRIVSVQNNREPPGIFFKYAREFVDAVVPLSVQQTLVPEPYETVVDRQARPSQRAIISRVIAWMGCMGSTIISSFQKREAYGKVTAPRNISTLPGALKVDYSRYLYTVADFMKSVLKCYAFGITPCKISVVVTDILRAARTVCLTDFSKFDGTHSKFLCDFELMFLKALFAPEYHREIQDLYTKQYNATGYTTFGCKYNTGFSRLSGSPETSAFNTIDNMFVAFCAFRRMGYCPKDAYDRLGLYGGDDGMTPDISVAKYTETAKLMGLKLTPEVRKRGEPINFLSRVWPNPWDGDVGSFTSVHRQAQKLHLTTAGNEIPVADVMYRKALGYIITDRFTPILGSWAKNVIRLLGDKQNARLIPGDTKWYEKYDGADQFSAPEDHSLMYELVAQDCGTTVSEIHRAEVIFDDAWCLTDLFPGYLFQPKELKVELLVKMGTEVLDKPISTVTPPVEPKKQHPRRTKNKPQGSSAASTVTASISGY